MKLIRAVVFDMDGVLIDARDWHYRSLNEALQVFGTSISWPEHIDRFDGLPTRVKLQKLTEEGRLPLHLHADVEEIKQERTLREAANLCFPRISHLLMLSSLRRRGYKIACATNSIRVTAKAMLGYAGILPYLDELVTNQDVTSPKPSPEIYLTVATKLGLEPAELLVIEDHDYGAAAAVAAGCQTLKVEGVENVNSSTIDRVLREYS